MTGDARQGINMKLRLGKPFGVALDRLRILMTFGALGVDVTTRYRQQWLYSMRFMAIGATGMLCMLVLIVIGINGGVTILAFGPRWPDAVRRMFFRHIVMTGNATDARVGRQLIFRRVDVKMSPLIQGGPAAVAVKTFAVRCILRRCDKYGQERCSKHHHKPLYLAHQSSSSASVMRNN